MSLLAPGATDEQVMARAANESRILVTFDKDFGELVYRRGLPPPAGIVLLRFDPQSPESTADRLSALIATGHELAGRFTVLTRRAVRSLPLPRAQV
jgi:predicted nuclease of predicted toxin-antitoxin system